MNLKVTKRRGVTLDEAAQRLGVSRAAIYGRIKRDTVLYRKRNAGGYEVQRPLPHDGSGTTKHESHVAGQDDETVALKVEVAVLRDRVDQMQARLDDKAHEVERLERQLDEAGGLGGVSYSAERQEALNEQASTQHMHKVLDRRQLDIPSRNSKVR